MSTLPRLLHDRIAATPDRRAYSAFVGGGWRDASWRDYGDRARAFGLGLVASGMKRGEVVAILGQTRAEWSFCDLGAICAGGVTVGLYPTLQPTGIGSMQYILTHSNARYLVVENGTTLESKIVPIAADLSRVERIVVWDCDDQARALDPRVVSLDEVLALGEALDRKQPNAWRDACGAARPDDLALLIYTSGTTGQPKGAMISHRNAWSEAEGLAAVSPAPGDDDCTVAFLPLAHVAERCTVQHLRIKNGIAAHYARSLETLMDDIAYARPTQFGSVPRIFEKAYLAVRAEVAKLEPPMRAMAEKVLAAGVAAARAKRRGEGVDGETTMLAAVFDQQVGAKVRARFGGRCTRLGSGAAPIAVEILELFDACGMPTFEVYGLTETTGVATANPPDAIRFGTVGKALPGIDVRIAADGEILVRGPTVFLGYLHDVAATTECMKDAWLYTGDIGQLDADGYLTITDRKKNILVTAGGKNITPSNIEGEVKRDPIVSYCHLHADRRPYPVALVCLDAERVRAFAVESGLPGTTAQELHADERLRARVQEAIERANGHLARFEQIRKFEILPRELSIEAGELTPTLKVKRREVDRKYADLLDALYRDA